MCRWAAWLGRPIHIENIVSLPDHSLVCQSRAATKCKTATNGDGFGLAWYADRPEPGLYRDVLPAWGDPNLASMGSVIRSRCFMAHVRASTGAAISRNNCHPFRVACWSFMHNGQIQGFETFRRHADMLIPDALYSQRRGATDSEAIFLLALKYGLDENPANGLSLALAELGALACRNGEDLLIRVAAAVSDGQSIWAVRYASDDKAPSLFYRYDEAQEGWIISSEPLDQDISGWTKLPANTIARFHGATIELADFDVPSTWPGADRAA